MSSARHIAVLAFPFGSHAGPLLSLVRRIAKAVPDVIFSVFSTAKSNRIVFSQAYDGGPHNINPYHVDDGLPDGYVPSGNPVEPVELFLKAAPENFTKALEKVEAETGLKIGCLISDAFFWFAGDMAEKINVPWIALWTAAPRSLFVHVDTDAIRQALATHNESGEEDQKLEFIPEFAAFHKSDLPEGVNVVGRPESPFDDLLHKMGNKLPQATAVAINSFEEFDPEIGKQLKTRFKRFLYVGPFTLASPSPTRSDDHGCLEWLNRHRPHSVVYVSFGTVITPPPNEISALADALEGSEFPFLWSFRGDVDELLPKGFAERTSGKGKLVPWAPQLQVLEHDSVGAFVTHCGWNSILESNRGCVPMICRPFFGDQKLNMRTVESVWRTGVQVEGGVITKNGAVKAMERIFLVEGEKMRERMGVLKKLAREAVQPNGTTARDFNTLIQIIKQL